VAATFDILIRNGLVCDGTGAPAWTGDVAISGDRIAAVGHLDGACAAQVVDAAGLVVAPGFIDAHSHSDTYLLLEPDAPSKISQGVTTEICGQCGASAAPLVGQARLPADWAAQRYPVKRSARLSTGADGTGPTWSSVAEYRALLEQVQPAVNTVLLIGHNTLRAGVMGYESRGATADELRSMQRHLAQALDEGGSGLSTGLVYQPGRYASADEVLGLARMVAARGGVYASHMRSEGDQLLEALDEVLDLGRASGVRVQVSHLKTSHAHNWGKLDAVFQRIAAAQRQGVVVHADRYPYLAGATDLDIVLPDWAGRGGREVVLARVADASLRARIAAELDAEREPDAWEGVMIGGTVHPDLRVWRGATIASVAQATGRTAGTVIVDVLRLDELRTGAFFFGMSEANLRRIYAQPWVMVGSDASIRALQGPLRADHPHPRAYGAFPRFLRLVQDEGLLTLPEAIRRLTSLPADAFGLQGRGRVVPAALADLVLFDPVEICDQATFAAPHVYSRGVRQVWVNGCNSYEHGQCTGRRAGRMLQSRF
jgi:N-acyl-D-amino-acid deacylase